MNEPDMNGEDAQDAEAGRGEVQEAMDAADVPDAEAGRGEVQEAMDAAGAACKMCHAPFI